MKGIKGEAMPLFFLLLIFMSCAHDTQKVVVAHRGASGYLPEHTLEGVAMAHAWGVDYIEPDIVLTKDNHPIVLHDIHLDTTTDVSQKFPRKKRKNGRFYAVDFTLSEIKTLNVHERISLKTKKKVFKKRFPLADSHFEVPTLVEFIELVQGLNKTTGKKVGIYPELKKPEFHQKHGKDIAKIVLKVLTQYGYNKQDAPIYVQCFYPPTLKRLRQKLGAKMPLIALIAQNSWEESSWDYSSLQTEEGIKEIASYVNGMGPYTKQLYSLDNTDRPIPTKLVSYAKKYGLKIHPYTHRVDQLPKGFRSSKEFFNFFYKQLEVDGIFSDFGDVALRFSK